MTYGRYDFQPLPPYRDPRDALALALPSLAPPRKVSVVEAAEASMRVNINNSWTRFRRDTVPYMIEPMNMATSREYRAMVFAGPSRSGKTMLLNAILAHAITCDPARIGFYVDERKTRDSYVRNKLQPIVRNSPDLSKKRGSGTGSDTVDSKIFLGGTHITIDAVSGASLQERDLQKALATEFDQYGSDVDGEGEPLNLMQARATFIIIGGERINLDAPPDWARLDPSNPFARFVGEAETAPVQNTPEPLTASWIPKRENWL